MESKKIEQRQEDAMRLLPAQRPVLLALFLRLPHLPGMHERKPLGDDVQQYHLGVPRLRQDTRLLNKNVKSSGFGVSRCLLPVQGF
jgi:hypothetical protein